MNEQQDDDWMQTQFMPQELMKYQIILREYCFLSVKRALTEAQADRINAILQQAESEPLLNLLLDEADHFVAHELNLVDEAMISTQQKKFHATVQRFEKTEFLITPNHRSNDETAKLQTALKREGLYTGAIDGVCGPRTQEALTKLRSRPLNHWVRKLLNSETWSTC